MKHVLLIGDSIRLGYQARVQELLGDKVQIHAPAENCRYTKFALWGMFSWMEGELGNPHLDAAHWGTGCWDLHRVTADGLIFTPVEEYALYQRRMVIQMRSYTPNICFANILPGGAGLDESAKINALINTDAEFPKMLITAPRDEWNADVVRYNAAAEAVMKEMGVPVNDMYTAINADVEKYISDDGIHPTPEGYDLLAHMVVDRILEMIEK